MRKILLVFAAACLITTGISAQVPDTIDKNNAVPTLGSPFGKDEVRTVKFDSLSQIFIQHFDSANHNFTGGNFDGHGGTFIWDTSGSIHSNHFFNTDDTSGFVLMDSEAMGDDTQRVTLTSPAFSTSGYNRVRLYINHHYRYSENDSAALIMASVNGTLWTVIKNFSADTIDRGSSLAFVTDSVYLPSTFLNKPTVYVRVLYATDSGYQWAINRLGVNGSRYNPGYNFFKPATNKDWDLTNIVYDGGYKFYPRKSAPNPWKYADSLYNEDLMGLQHTTYELNYFTIQGIVADAHLTYEQILPLGQQSGNPSDTMRIPVQTVGYSGLHTKMPYPCTFGTRWASDYWFLYNVDVKGPSFNTTSTLYATAKRRVLINQRDTVVGWGRMRIKDPGGNNQSYINVLQVKSVIQQRDSFYADDSAKNILFRNFVASQGLDTPFNQWNYIKMSYYRIGEIHPFVTVFMQDTFVHRIEVHIDRPWPVEVKNASLTQEAIEVYPNPVSGRLVNVAISVPQEGNWGCELMNVMGQSVAAQALNLGMGNTKATVNIPQAAAPGTYYLRIMRDGQIVAVKPVIVQD
jgi:hypothetical protein